FDESDKSEISSRIDALKEALKGQDINLIKSKQEELQSKFYEISEKIYKAAQQANVDPNAAAAGYDQNAAQGGADENGYYDADFKDVTGE
ncbi:MAG: molecular chaperone DnaK, partial [Clostridia bacterium]|nr:molecular chaperone DnaK [Clostridia bacterium]